VTLRLKGLLDCAEEVLLVACHCYRLWATASGDTHMLPVSRVSTESQIVGDSVEDVCSAMRQRFLALDGEIRVLTGPGAALAWLRLGVVVRSVVGCECGGMVCRRQRWRREQQSEEACRMTVEMPR
jgi:hypothetical protein